MKPEQTNTARIITIGLTPAWDMNCNVDGIDWAEHKTVKSYSKKPAGKSLNISKALAMLGVKSAAAGLWSENDYPLMLEKLQPFKNFIDIQITPCPGNTRTNITLQDTKNHRHLHLRFPDELASAENLKKTAEHLANIIRQNDLCVFAGSMPDEKLLEHIFNIFRICVNNKAKIVLDTNGRIFEKIVEKFRTFILSPNLDELAELLNQKIPDRPKDIAQAAGKLLQTTNILLVSRGKSGAMAITSENTYNCKLTGQIRQTENEVGCGDHLLAGFIAGIIRQPTEIDKALEQGVKLATAHAWGITQTHKIKDIQKCIETTIEKI